METPRGGLSASVFNRKIYAIGGETSSGSTSTVEEYNPESEGKSINLRGKLSTTWGSRKR